MQGITLAEIGPAIAAQLQGYQDKLSTPGPEQTYTIIRSGFDLVKAFFVIQQGLSRISQWAVTGSGWLGRMRKLLKNFRNPDFHAIFNELSDSQKKSFLEDFEKATPEVWKQLDAAPGMVRAWGKIVGHPQLRVDIDVLESLSKALDDDYLKTLNLDQVITNKWTKHGFGCPTCTSGGKPWINELIDQLGHFKQFKDVDGYQNVLNQLLDQGKTQAIGSHWVMKFTKQKNLSPTKFEDFIDEATGDFSADIIANGNFIECKSWGSKPSGMSNVPNQMINYFNTQNSLSKFQFQFDPDRWVPSPSDLNQALKANSNLFNTVDDAVWDKYVAMVQSNVNDIPYGDVDALVDRITSPIIFSQIINP